MREEKHPIPMDYEREFAITRVVKVLRGRRVRLHFVEALADAVERQNPPAGRRPRQRPRR